MGRKLVYVSELDYNQSKNNNETKHNKFYNLFNIYDIIAVKLSLKHYTSIISSAIINRIIRYIREAKMKPDLVFYTAVIDTQNMLGDTERQR